MTETLSRTIVILALLALMAGAYALIAGGAASDSGVTATAKPILVKPPKGVAGEVLEGTGI